MSAGYSYHGWWINWTAAEGWTAARMGISLKANSEAAIWAAVREKEAAAGRPF